jgi:hypothetical protein
VWTEKAGKLIGFELDQDNEGVLMIKVENQKMYLMTSGYARHINETSRK